MDDMTAITDEFVREILEKTRPYAIVIEAVLRDPDPSKQGQGQGKPVRALHTIVNRVGISIMVESNLSK